MSSSTPPDNDRSAVCEAALHRPAESHDRFSDRGARGGHQEALIDAHHRFSFAGYNDPKHMGFRALRVLNEGRASPAPACPNRADMVIATTVLKGLPSIATTKCD